MSAPTKATVTIMAPTIVKGKVTASEVIKTFKVQFNPKEYSLQKSASWEHKPATAAKTGTLPEFKGANSAELSVELFLDATQTEPAELQDTVESLLNCCSLLEKTAQRKKPSAPFVVIEWGTLKFTGTVKQVAAKYTLFNQQGEPLRATCTVALSMSRVPSTRAATRTRVGPTWESPTSANVPGSTTAR